MSDLKTTPCGVCGKLIKYTTRKPKKCTVCRVQKETKKAGSVTSKPKARGKKPASKNTGGELILFKALNELLPGEVFINHGYYSNLPSPKGYPMQLDRYYPELKLAFEFQGRQHEEYTKYIHKSQKNFDYYQECDALKRQYCQAQGIALVEVAWNHKITEEALKRDIEKASPVAYEQLFKGGRR